VAKELRKHARIDLTVHRLQATLALIEENTITGCLVPIKDFSKSGAGIYLKFEASPQTHVRLSIEELNFNPLEGRIIWCAAVEGDSQVPTGFTHKAGIEFMPKDDTEKENQLLAFNTIQALSTFKSSSK